MPVNNNTHTVQSGQTLSQIAAANQTTVAELNRLNPSLTTQSASQPLPAGAIIRLHEDLFTGNGGGTSSTRDASVGAPLPAMGLGESIGVNPDQLPAHSKEPVTFEGATILPGALGTSYNDLPAEKFGTTDVKLPQPDGSVQTVNVRDLHYRLPDGKLGMKFVPVSDTGNVKGPDGKRVKGNQLMDDLLREEMGLKKDEPIYAFASYTHPEKHQGDLRALGSDMLKTEMGTTHLGAYVGEGRTTNSPESYHSNKWKVTGYPANVAVMSLEGVPQKTLNQNLLLADQVLNRGVQFPANYKEDIYRTVDLNSTLQFYRDWLKGEQYLLTDRSWHTYCAEHKTIVANIALNVPHNERSFQEIFGAEGKELWELFKQRFETNNARAFTEVDETDFEPLWKKEGLTPDQIRPMSKPEWDKYEAARFDGSLADGSYAGFRPLPPGKALAWAPETTADLIQDFIETYVPFQRTNGFVVAAALLGFKENIEKRMGLSTEQTLGLVLPIINKVMIAEAAARGPTSEDGLKKWADQAKLTLYVAYGGKPVDLAPNGTVDTARMKLAEMSLGGVLKAIPQVRALQTGTAEERAGTAAKWLRSSIGEDVERGRKQAVADPSKVEFYSPPAVVHRVATGLHEMNPYVRIRTVATAVDASEVEGQA
ncbi:MAG: LysM peptidoglycan-binding domain-containing protein [Myxococcaceae bacterium]